MGETRGAQPFIGIDEVRAQTFVGIDKGEGAIGAIVFVLLGVL